ncbi:DUF2523 domain-containing protein [Rheinheimera sediminis]|uniref:DUF2523 family protein n=1 Tax=Rheinheimera sp. YQF-1 TaxID=2499626 RepID=UPI000FDB5499|nr:DUF2523 family protein [Rheinheimera sp. YQF-1]RVT44647.1 DUF2523 domain-containing protein [Rheinheimera sp. YQF-1]
MPQFLIDFGNWLYDIFYAAVATVGVLIYDVLLLILEGFFIVGQTALDGIALTMETLNLGDYMTFLGPDVLAWIVAIGFTEAMGMVITGISIRLLLQIIPFTRLGS